MARTGKQEPLDVSPLSPAIAPPAGAIADSAAPAQTDSITSNWWPIFVIGCVGVVMVWLLYVACFIQLDYYDSFEVLLNAKRMAYRLPDILYRVNRTPLSALLYAPIFLIERWVGHPDFGFRASHLYALAFFPTLLFVTYRLLRLDFSKALAWLGVLLLALNPLLFHYAPMARDDIPGMLFTTLAFYCYLRAGRSKRLRDYLVAGLFIAMAMGVRYNTAPLMLLVIAAYELLSGHTRFRRGEGLWAKVIALFLIPCAIFMLFPVIVFTATGRLPITSFWYAPVQFALDVKHIYSTLSHYGFQPPMENYRFLIKALSPPVILLAIFGIGICIRKWPGHSLIYFLWLVLFFVYQTDFSGPKEARYLFIVFPPVLYFALVAIDSIGKRISGIVARAIATAALLVMPVIATVHEFIRFTEPVYYVNIEKDVSEFAGSIAGPHAIHWVGIYYPIYPIDYLFDRDDEYTSIYHMATHVMEFYLDRQVGYLGADQIETQSLDVARILYDNPRISVSVRNGDVLVINPQRYVKTDTVPKDLAPLVVQSVQVIRFKPAPDGDSNIYHSLSGDKATIRMEPTEQGYDVRGEALPDGPAVLDLRDLNDSPLGLVQIVGENGTVRQSFRLPAQYRRPIGTIRFVRTTNEKFFRPPVKE